MSSSSNETITIRPIVALEEHFMAPDHLLPPSFKELYDQQLAYLPNLESKLRSLGNLREQEMKIAGVTTQVISHCPGLSSCTPEEVRKVNDYLADAIRGKINMKGMAVLPMGYPMEAREELQRCTYNLGFVGAMIDNHVTVLQTEASVKEGVFYYDEPEYKDFWDYCNDEIVAVYIHPMFPPPSLVDHYDGPYPFGAAASMATSGWGWHSEVGLHILRLFAAGVFNERILLKIIVGHFGEMLPFMKDRVGKLSVRWGQSEGARGWEDVWQTSGVWSVDPLATIKRNRRVTGVLFSIDTPFASAEDGRRFWGELCGSGLYDEDELDWIAWRNATLLLHLKEKELFDVANTV